MKKLFAVLTMLFAFSFLSAAQTGSAPGSTSQPDNGQQSAEKGAAKKKAGGGATLTGCLSGPNDEGVYELKSGKRKVEVGGLDDLSKHVGHEVRLHGSWAKSGSEIGEKENAEKNEKEEKGEKGEKSEKAERHFKVASIDHISDTCRAASPKKSSKSSEPPKQ